VDLRQIKAIVRLSRPETGVLLVTFLGTLFLDMEFAIFSGVLLALLLYLNRTAHPHLTVLAPDGRDRRRPFVNVRAVPVPECPQLKILRLDGSIFFGAVNHIAEELHRLVERSPEQWAVLIIGSGINFIDVAGCEMLFHEGHAFHLGGRRICLCSLKREVLEVLRRGGCAENAGQGCVYGCKEEALAGMVPALDPARCRECRLRVFLECASMPAPDDWPGSPAEAGPAL
jgi:SulP family sulfate permease